MTSKDYKQKSEIAKFSYPVLGCILGRSVVSNHETHLGFVHDTINQPTRYAALRASIW